MNYENSLKITIPYNYVTSEATTGFDLSVYSYLYLITFNNLYEEHHIHITNISYAMFNKSYKIKEIQKSLNKLYNSKQFDIKQLSQKEYIVNNKSLQNMTERFITIPFRYIRQLVTAKKYDLVKMLALIIANRNLLKKNCKGQLYLTTTPQTEFANQMNTSLVTISNYTTTLEKMNIIYIIRNTKEYNKIVLYNDKKYLT